MKWIGQTASLVLVVHRAALTMGEQRDHFVAKVPVRLEKPNRGVVRAPPLDLLPLPTPKRLEGERPDLSVRQPGARARHNFKAFSRTEDCNVTKPIALSLSADEALVLYDWIRRFNGEADRRFADQAEERVLWDIEAALESELEAPLRRDYEAILAGARARVRDPAR